MPANHEQATALRSVSMRGLLAFICGCGSLLGYWKFSQFTVAWPAYSRRAFVVVALVLVVWGAYQLINQLLPGRQARRRRGDGNQNLVTAPSEGLVYLGIMCVLLVGSMLGHSNMLMLVFALMAGPFIVNGWVTYSMLRRIDVHRSLPRRVMAGELVSVNVRFRNRRLWLSSWLMTVTDHIANRHERLKARVLFVRVPTRGESVGQYQLRLMQRGVYQFGPIHATTRFPFGLVERGLMMDAPAELIVHPRVGHVTERWRRDRLAAAEVTQQRDTHAGLFEDEFHRIREFRAGDNPRAIHWRSAARRNELMVREYRQSRDRDLAVLLDLWVPRRPTDADLDRVELAVSFAATVCVHYLRCGRDANLTLIARGETLSRWSGRAVAAGIEPVLDRLAVIQPHHAADVDPLIESWRSERTLSNTRTVLVTTRPGGPSNEQAFAKLMRVGSNGSAIELPGAVDVIEADRQSLERYFQPG